MKWETKQSHGALHHRHLAVLDHNNNQYTQRDRLNLTVMGIYLVSDGVFGSFGLDKLDASGWA